MTRVGTLAHAHLDLGLAAVAGLARAAGLTRSHLRLWLLIVVATILLYTTLYVIWDGWSLSDALYMTVITLTTVGYKEVRGLDEVGRVITVAGALSGAALILAEWASWRRRWSPT